MIVAPAAAADPDCDNHLDRDNAAILADLQASTIDRQIRPVSRDRTGEEWFHLVVDLTASRLTWLLEILLIPIA